MSGLRLRTFWAIAGLFFALVMVLPNVINPEGKWWLPKQKLNYGLDIQGGLHLVMGVDINGVVSESTTRLANEIKLEVEKKGMTSGLTVNLTKPAEGEFQVTGSAEAIAEAKKLMSERYSGTLQVSEDGPDKLIVRYYQVALQDKKSKTISQAIETIRNRIDEFGVAEPSISQQGSDRILVQLPGMADAERAKALVNTAAKLEFMIVEDDLKGLDLAAEIQNAEKAGSYDIKSLKYTEYVKKVNADLASKIPPNTMILFEKMEGAQSLEAGKIPLVVRTDTGLGGEGLDDASMGFDQYGKPEVNLKFNPVGTVKFKEITGKNVGRRMAIVLDKVIKSAPNLQTEIGGGRAVITLGSGRDPMKQQDEAKMISMALRAGSLPATLEQLEERRVGPSLGADSIKKAQLASVIGSIIIVIFMLLRYKTMGLVTDICLGVNVLTILALLTSLKATLTLPGIAGIALTVGFAVDANVLINERIREELAKGSSLAGAIREGYHRAMSAILDSNATTASTACVLLYFGTGPVKGFAVTLLIGIATTLFANVFLSKVIVDLMINKYGVKKLSV
jgi:preprotein translocase subunit SecD